MLDQPFKPISQFVQDLAQYCQDGLTGTFYLASSDNRAGAISLDRGQIIGLRYSSKADEAALEALQTLKEISYRFNNSTLIPSEVPLPATPVILEKLGLKSKPSSSVSVLEHFDEDPFLDMDTLAATTLAVSEDFKQRCQQELAEVIGPIAGILCQRTLEQHPQATPADFLEALMNQIPDPQAALDFQQRTQSWIK